ncbi:hypothetical protein TruAng_007542 [Truncatella angustata]|nr:hypothetical protein TruAng_007542 [Truncatella angustata]
MVNILQSTIGELCRNGSENQFGPRVDVSCRPFDFTLLFEDIFFAALPATIFLCVLPLRLRTLWKCPNEASSHKRATWKFVFYTVLLAFHVLQLAFRLQEPQLNTSMSTASGCVMTVMVIAAGVLSYLENQRSIRPSDLLVLYFSASSLLSVPGLRSYWLAQSSTILRSLTTVTWLMTTLAVFLESAQKTDLVRPVEKGASKEQLVGLWSRGFFSWALPFLRHGYSSILTLAQVPRVDHELREDVTWNKLQSYWHSVKKGNYRLLRATFWSHLWLFVSAVPPRLALSAFVFCQPFLISSSVSYLATEAQNRADEYFAPSLIGAFVLVYLGIAVSRALYWRQTNRTIVSIRSCLIAMVYRHATGLRAASLKNTAIVTLMGTDVHRIAVTSSMLSNMKTVRMLGMTKTIKNSVTKLRELELQTSERFRVLLIWQILLGNAPVTIAPFITFVVYAIIAVATKSEALISAQAFASLSLISLATSPLIKFCQALPNLAQAAACFGRIQDFCLKEANLPVLNTSTPSTDSCNDTLVLREMSPIQYGDDGVLMRFERADIAWDSNSGSVLRNLTFRLCSGLTAITGPVASGKSTLLWTMLGETILKVGSMTSAVREAAFCAQVPWIMDDTIRHNITLGLEFDEEWYNFSIASSCLQKDLMELPRGDATSAGSDGASLSGGQRQRVALARAIYSRLPIVILDNISSGLDARTASALCNRLFRYDGYFRRAGISVVIATNDGLERFLRYMDTILILEGGNVLRSGSYQELFRTGLVEQDSSSETLMEVARTSSSDSSRFTQQETRHQAIHDQTGAPSDFDARPNGNWSVYAYYGRSAGARSILAWAISLFVKASEWGLMLLIRIQDMDMIDMVLPMQAAQFTTGAAYGTVQLVILCVLGRYLTATVPACAGVLFFLQRYYLRTSRQLRLIDIEAKAPLYKHFIETLSGVTTIRMFGRGPAFHQQHQQMLDSAQAPYYILLSQTVQTWTKLETSIGAVSRVQNFLKDTPQEPVGHLAIQTEWPPLGLIRFENVVAGYVTQDLPVLTDLNLSIGPGEKIAICGPSGSGKSTILLALLRMIDIQGNIIIDNINISHLSGDDLRSRLNVLPQESFFLPGTIKSNLDVRGLSSMDAIQVAVERVGLWNRVRSLGGLEANLDPSQWSQGEKQLLCLARAILTPSKVLILDEATSSVDDKTESIMLDVIGSAFREQTVISVVHRYARIEQYDRVAVLKEGKIVEYDTPQTLLSHDSVFGELFRAYESKQFERN